MRLILLTSLIVLVGCLSVPTMALDNGMYLRTYVYWNFDYIFIYFIILFIYPLIFIFLQTGLALLPGKIHYIFYYLSLCIYIDTPLVNYLLLCLFFFIVFCYLFMVQFFVFFSTFWCACLLGSPFLYYVVMGWNTWYNKRTSQGNNIMR